MANELQQSTGGGGGDGHQQLSETPRAQLSSQSVLAPSRTPRPNFQLTRRLVGVSKYPLALLTAIYAIQQTHQFLLPALFPLIKEDFLLSDAALGILGSSFILTLTIGMIPFGILADRVRRTWVIGWGTTAYSIALIYSGLAPSYAHLLAGRTLLGIADPANNPTSLSLLADYYPLVQRGKVMSIYEAGRILGTVIVPIVSIAAVAWGWRSALFLFSIPGFIVALLAWFLHEPQRGIQERRHQNIEGQGGASRYDEMSQLRAFLACLRVPTFLVSFLSSGVAGFFLGGAGVWTVTFLVRYHEMELSTATAALSLFALGSIVGSLAAGYVADNLRTRGIHNARIYVAGALRVVAFFILAFTFSTGHTTMMLISLTAGAAVLTGPVPVLNAVRADVLHPKIRGRGNSLDAIGQSGAAALSPVLIGFLSDQFTLQSAMLSVLPIVGVAGIFLLILGPIFYRRDEQRVLTEIAEESGGDGPPPSHGEDGNGELPSGPSGGAEPARAPAPSDGVPAEPVESGHGARPLLEVEALDFSYGALQALFGIDFHVAEGECVAILGANGAGKTTFLKVLSGVLEPQAGDGGDIWFRAMDIVGVPPEQRARLGISLMAGGRSTFPSLSVEDNLWLGAYGYADSRQLVQERMAAVLEVFPELSSRLRQAGGTLSGGEQQMMVLGRALMSGADLLLIDELSMGLAPVVIDNLTRAVDEIKRLGTTLVIVEQSVKVATGLADRAYLMEKGELRPLGDAVALTKLDEMSLARLAFGDHEARETAGLGRDGA